MNNTLIKKYIYYLTYTSSNYFKSNILVYGLTWFVLPHYPTLFIGHECIVVEQVLQKLRGMSKEFISKLNNIHDN